MQEIRNRRSIRRYLPRQVESEKIKQLIEAARLAPSGSNCQDWHFILVQSEEIRRQVVAACPRQSWMVSAPVLIVCIAGIDQRDPSLKGVPLNEESPYPSLKMAIRDLAIAVQQMTLEATHMGLGSCWVGSLSREQLRSVLGIPVDKYPLAVLAVGYPAEDPPARPRKPVTEILHLEHW